MFIRCCRLACPRQQQVRSLVVAWEVMGSAQHWTTFFFQNPVAERGCSSDLVVQPKKKGATSQSDVTRNWWWLRWRDGRRNSVAQEDFAKSSREPANRNSAKRPRPPNINSNTKARQKKRNKSSRRLGGGRMEELAYG